MKSAERRRFLHSASSFTAGLLAASICPTSLAQSKSSAYPNRQIHLIVPSAPGGAADIIARLLGEVLHQRTGQPVIVDNKAGGNSLIGVGQAARAAPDGYTLLVSPDQPFAANPALYTPQQLPYDASKSFEPVTPLINAVQLLLVHSSVPAKSFDELVRLAKSEPGRLTYASSGNGSAWHINFEQIKKAAGIDLLHVPYKGGGPVITALVGGEVNMAIFSFGAAEQFIKGGKLRPLAVSGTQRLAELPDVPTFSEVLRNFQFLTSWIGLFAPAGTPKDIVEQLNKQVVAATQTPEFRNKLQKGLYVFTSTPADFSSFVREEQARWGAAIRATGVKVD